MGGETMKGASQRCSRRRRVNSQDTFLKMKGLRPMIYDCEGSVVWSGL